MINHIFIKHSGNIYMRRPIIVLVTLNAPVFCREMGREANSKIIIAGT